MGSGRDLVTPLRSTLGPSAPLRLCVTSLLLTSLRLPSLLWGRPEGNAEAQRRKALVADLERIASPGPGPRTPALRPVAQGAGGRGCEDDVVRPPSHGRTAGDRTRVPTSQGVAWTGLAGDGWRLRQLNPGVDPTALVGRSIGLPGRWIENAIGLARFTRLGVTGICDRSTAPYGVKLIEIRAEGRASSQGCDAGGVPCTFGQPRVAVTATPPSRTISTCVG